MCNDLYKCRCGATVEIEFIDGYFYAECFDCGEIVEDVSRFGLDDKLKIAGYKKVEIEKIN